MKSTIQKGTNMADKAPKFQRWEVREDQYWPIGESLDTLPPGYYEVSYDIHSTQRYYYTQIDVHTQDLVRFPDAESDKVIHDIRQFWGSLAQYDRYGIVYKRGILVYGPPGSGKSCTIRLVAEDVIARNGIVIKWGCAQHVRGGLRTLRQIQPDLPIVILIEDIDAVMDNEDEDATVLLNLLDGIDSPSGVVFLATTNYAEKLQRRIANRPSRFDRRFRIGMPNEEARHIYFKHLCNGEFSDQDMKKWVADTEGLSLAHLKELFIQVIILKSEYDEALKNLHEMSKKLHEEPENEEKIGLTARKVRRADPGPPGRIGVRHGHD